jgi:hypothetical protein
MLELPKLKLAPVDPAFLVEFRVQPSEDAVEQPDASIVNVADEEAACLHWDGFIQALRYELDDALDAWERSVPYVTSGPSYLRPPSSYASGSVLRKLFIGI